MIISSPCFIISEIANEMNVNSSGYGNKPDDFKLRTVLETWKETRLGGPQSEF